MSEPVSLFAEMTAAADALRRDNPDLREALAEELQLLFREVQKRRMPELSTVESIELFRVWGLAYAGRCERQREDINATSEEYARANVPADPFVCPCGAVLNDPLDPAVMAIRQLHYAAAKAARGGGGEPAPSFLHGNGPQRGSVITPFSPVYEMIARGPGGRRRSLTSFPRSPLQRLVLRPPVAAAAAGRARSKRQMTNL